jgi:hypothetical protein
LRRADWPALQRRLARAAEAGRRLVFSIASWEVDASQPVVRGADGRAPAAHYAGLAGLRERLSWCLREFRCTSVAEGLGIAPGTTAPLPPVGSAAPSSASSPSSSMTSPAHARKRVAIVVPLLDEEEGIPYLLRTLGLVQQRLADRWDFQLVLVDDGSRDRTWELLQQAAAARPDIALARHETNRGVAAGIMTGLRTATTDIVCSIDGDLSYDPFELERMLPLIAEADLVTASPYHPQGAVRSVPAWRLSLSKGLSWIYRRLLRRRIHTWTSCFRVYRREAVVDLQLDNQGFLGVAEMLIRLVRRGARIVEHPAVLESRLLGFSKMKTLRTVRQHLQMCWRIVRGRVR